ncbi:urea carboxylase-associated family protein [Paenibacillus oralis]|uniref:Urea carboxylase-associated family protein n=1 Tax=Paenibacillus oralis TaxID=2490856 RepID=A0A3P3TZE2_9BACL|nr:urea amidolyase associated protein UAAP1 [Paenibacillus oralis]RRJ62739.1 urea carboxylase-associated family protein [Paenibacillus oralis]
MNVIWSETMHLGGKWSGVIGRGKLIRLTALEAGANVAMLMYHARDLSERYNMPDTLKAQHTAHLTKGNVLMSDNGRVLASIVQDDLGWHDPLGGYTTRESTDAKYGLSRYQEKRNEWLRSGRENLAVELTRSGLGNRDLSPVVNWFSKVFCDEEGNMNFDQGHCAAGQAVTLRTEMDVLVIFSNTPHPLDPREPYPSVPVKIEVLPGLPVDSQDPCVNYRPENRRAFDNTWNYYALQS